MIVHRLALAALVLSAPADALPPVAGPLASIFRRQASTTSTAAASSSESTTTAAATSVSSIATATAAATATSRPSGRKKDSVPYMQEYLRDWVTTNVPIADNSGHLYLNPVGDDGNRAVGRAASSQRRMVPYNSIENKNLRKFYSSHLFTIPDPADRAAAHKNASTALWDCDAMARAAREFEIPANTSVTICQCGDLKRTKFPVWRLISRTSARKRAKK